MNDSDSITASECLSPSSLDVIIAAPSITRVTTLGSLPSVDVAVEAPVSTRASTNVLFQAVIMMQDWEEQQEAAESCRQKQAVGRRFRDMLTEKEQACVDSQLMSVKSCRLESKIGPLLATSASDGSF